ncbi:hypothetical protein F3Y22_tig00110890pilonHSYRG01679 [Hibiscus syriacus]|uniref:Uncharacterized protein n=1 Tax=Hibiscus syriacus TaxID=106335 RepID=A0A6A2ZJ10_HIBSY|nr:hypothetical protein F3Y22_tig00110890pilonHSYRG01679 [Hibiscus syriacus]
MKVVAQRHDDGRRWWSDDATAVVGESFMIHENGTSIMYLVLSQKEGTVQAKRYTYLKEKRFLFVFSNLQFLGTRIARCYHSKRPCLPIPLEQSKDTITEKAAAVIVEGERWIALILPDEFR